MNNNACWNVLSTESITHNYRETILQKRYNDIINFFLKYEYCTYVHTLSNILSKILTFEKLALYFRADIWNLSRLICGEKNTWVAIVKSGERTKIRNSIFPNGRFEEKDAIFKVFRCRRLEKSSYRKSGYSALISEVVRSSVRVAILKSDRRQF